MTITIRGALALGTALSLSMGLAAPSFAQITPGDQTGTPTSAGAGQSAATATNAPATDQTKAAPPPRAARLESGGAADIIVTARRVEERLQDVPISITVFNQQQINNRNVTSATGLATYTPSLSANSNFGGDNTSFAIRGFVQDAGTAPSVGVYFADVVALRGPTQGTQAGDTAGPNDFFDLQNVQVLKGPQGTLFGRNTTGGAVLFVPQKPTGKFEGYVEGSYGNYDMKRVQAAVNLPITDVARFRVAIDHQNRDGWLHNISGIGPSGYNDIDYTAVRASLVVDLTPDLENYTIVSYSRSSNNGTFNKLIGCNPTGANPTGIADISAGAANFVGLLSCGQLARERAAGAGFFDAEAAVDSPRSLVEQWQVINTTTWKATDTLTIKNIASYGQFRDYQRSPLFGTNWSTADLAPIYRSFIFTQGSPRIFTGIFPAPNLNSANQYTLTDEIQLQGSALADKLSYQGGFYYEYSGPLGLIGNQSPQLVPCTDLANLVCSDPLGAGLSVAAGRPVQVGAVNYTAGRTTFRNLGVYSQVSYSITEQLKLTGGIRYTWDRQTNSSSRLTYQFPASGRTVICTDPASAPTCGEYIVQRSSKPTWLIDLDYKPVDDMLLYGKWSRGYRAGGVFANAPIDYRAFDPEKVDSFEIGAKTSFRGAVRGTFNVSAFYNDFSNQQLQFGFDARVTNGVPAPVSPTTAIVNAGKSRIWGVEVEASINPFRGFTVDASYTYLNATIRKIATIDTNDPNYQVQTADIPRGSPLVLSPKNKATVTATYTLPLAESIGKIAIAATYTHTDKQLTSYAYVTNPALIALFGRNYGILRSTDLVNVNATWSSVAGSPIDITGFVTNVTNKKYYAFVPGLASSGSEYAALGEPRMYGGRIRYHF